MNLKPEEYRQLESIKMLYPWAGWVAKTVNKNICVYELQPCRNIAMFGDKYVLSDRCIIKNKNILPSLTWESEPLNIDEALKNRSEL